MQQAESNPPLFIRPYSPNVLTIYHEKRRKEGGEPPSVEQGDVIWVFNVYTSLTGRHPRSSRWEARPSTTTTAI